MMPLDRGVRIVLFTRLVPLIAAPVTLLLVATQRPIAEQGLYFVYWNVQALSQLMELGIGSLIVQFASHESPYLAWNERGALSGDLAATHRLYRVTREGIQWYWRVALAMLIVGGLGGTWLLRARSSGISPDPIIPWLVTVVTTAAYLPVVPILCTIEGCGGLLRVQGMRFAQVALAVIGLWCVLPIWGALWGVATFSVIWFCVAIGWLVREHPGLVAAVRDVQRDSGTKYLGTEQWRSGTTWLALWIAPQALTPIVLATHGSSAAGRVGMSLAIATAPLTLASAWLSGRYPSYGALLSREGDSELTRLASRATVQAMFVLAAGTLGAMVALWLLGRAIPSLAARALAPASIGILGVGNLAWLLFQSAGGYLRAWRVEPLSEAAAAGATMVIAGTWVAARQLSAASTVTAYALLVLLVMVPLAARVLARHRETTSIGTRREG